MNLLVALGVALALSLAGLAVQTKRLEDIKAEYASFVSNAKLLGEQAVEKAKVRELQDNLNKEKIDAENLRLHASLAVANKRLRDVRSSSGLVPPAAPSAGRSDVACFDRGLLQSALSRYEDEIATGFEGCDQAVTDLDSAKHWAASASSIPR